MPDSLKNDGIIKPIQEVFPDELRYDVADNSLEYLILGVWLVYERRPTEADKQYLRIFLGDTGTDRFLAYTYGFRRKWEPNNNDMKQTIKKWEENRALLVEDIKEEHKRVILENEVIADIIEGVCSSPVFHMTTHDEL